MKTLGVTIGAGPGWKEAAEITAERMSRATGADCAVISRDPLGMANPSWLKCHVLDIFPGYDRYFVFDADLLCLRPWDLTSIIEEAGDRWIGVRDRMSDPVKLECLNYNLDSRAYMNLGFSIFTPDHVEVWERTLRGHPTYGSWLEQTGVNSAIQQTRTPLMLLPPAFNYLWFWFAGVPLQPAKLKEAGVVNLHMTSLHGGAKVLRAIQERVFDECPLS